MGRGLAQGDRAEADRAAGGALSPASVRGVTSTRKTRRYAPGQKLAAQGIDTMTRFLIFAAMAPPLGFVVAFWVMLQVANWLAGSPNTFDVAQIMMLPTIYLVGLIPALLAAWFDHALAKRNVSYRIALTALFGYAISAAGNGVLGGFRPRAGSPAVRPHRRGAISGVLVAGDGGQASDLVPSP